MLSATLLISSLASLALASPRHEPHLLGTSFGIPGENRTFDYVVVGGGLAGLTIATRLAQTPNTSVAVLEAGSFYELDNGNRSQIPAFDFYSTNVSSLDAVNGLIDWRFLTTRQPGYADRILHYPRGKCLGGSSARNYMVYNRGTVGQFKQWADDVGDSSYEWDSIFPFYKESVHFTPANGALRAYNVTPANESGAYSCTGGPLQVSYPNYDSPWTSFFEAGANELGLQQLPGGANQGRLIGRSFVPATIDPKQETRSSSETSFLRLALETTDLTVYTHALAKKVLFDDQKRAWGVAVDVAGMKFVLNATKEVILSAGAFQSPQLLMVSGIGPASALDPLGIPVVADRPGVGQNMWDNLFLQTSYEVGFVSSSVLSYDPSATYMETQKYLQNKTGMLTASGADYFLFDKVSDKPWANISKATSDAFQSAFAPDWPEIQLASLASGSVNGTRNFATILGGLLTTFSRGNITINSTDAADAPIINPNWALDPRDQELAVGMIKYARRLANTTALREIIIGDEVAPGPDVQTDAQILNYVQQTGATFYHAAGACKMGRKNDTMAVVDSDAKVIGVSGLRVVDISAFPVLPPGQPQSAVYMLAEKIADRMISRA